MSDQRPPRAPKGLGSEGRALWRRMVGEFDFRTAELAILESACRQADDVARLEAAIATDGVVVTGSRGQPRLSSVVTEVRQGRLALARLLSQLALPGQGELEASASRLGSHGARARWGGSR